MLHFMRDDGTNERGPRAVADFDVGGTADQSRIAVKDDNAIAFGTTRQLKCRK